MAEGYNFQLLTAIVKVVRPKDKPVIGVGDGLGNFMWIGTENIIVAHPNKYDQWQTTIFALVPDYKIEWIPEKNFEQYKGTYSKTKPVLQPIPPMFQGASLTPTPVQSQPTNYPQQSQTPAPNQPQQSQTYQQPTAPVPLHPSPPAGHIPLQQTPIQNTVEEDLIKLKGLRGLRTPDYLQEIAEELGAIRKLLELYIKPPKLVSADTLVPDAPNQMELNQIENEYGVPPNEIDELFDPKIEPKVNKGKLPDIFG
ncbi:hypothetical protein LCGC14_1698600 [marine sediment metagenome]|uniref:Uncharacterized protein n=1 Tax=marine sediment metagenome TaxID=412755 RepID=A0A0F9KIN6_9ZZZZ